jgi:hypothetical protein
MTVISGMKFNKNIGAIVTDEQSSYGGSSHGERKSDIAIKLAQLNSLDNNTSAILGGSGSSVVLYDVVQQATYALKEPDYKDLKNSWEMARLVSLTMAQVKKKYIDGYLHNAYRLREADFQAGSLITPEGGGFRPMEPSLLQQYHQLLSGQGDVGKFLNNGFIILSQDNQGIQLFHASMSFSNPSPVSESYITIGSGADIADTELYAFFENMSREKRENIDPISGVSALLYATERASARNQGVGGTPLVGIVQNNSILMPKEDNCKLSVELVKAQRYGILSNDFIHPALEELLFKNGQSEAVEKEMWKQAAGNEVQLSRFLRGYKLPSGKLEKP